MDLSSLYTTLPPGQLAQAERQMMEKFKAAALSITTLYKSSLNTSKQAYTAGYSACLADVLQTLHASLVVTPDTQHPQSAEEAGRTLGRLMDWIEARQEALKLQDEDEREDSEAPGPGMGMSASMHAESSAQGAARLAQAEARAGVPPRPRRRGSGSRSPRMDEDAQLPEAPTMPIPAIRTDHQRMVRTGSHSRQRDALVQAMNRHQSQSRPAAERRGRSEVAEEDGARGQAAPPIEDPTPTATPTPAPAIYRDTARSNLIEASSPLQAYAANTPLHPRPAKALPHHAKGKTAPLAPASSSIFAPDLPVDIPFIPLFDPAAVDSSDVAPLATDTEVRIGAKRPLVVEAAPFGREGAASAPPTGAGISKALRRRMGGREAERWTGEAASTPVSDSEERERKRVTRRT